MDHEQGIRAGRGAVHPMQPPVHPEAGLVQPRDRARGDLLAGMLQEPAQPAGGPRCERGPADSGTPNNSASACAVRSFDRNCPMYR